MRLSPMFKDTKVTYSNSSLKLKGRKYATELIPVKSYEKFFCVKDSRRYHKSSAKAR